MACLAELEASRGALPYRVVVVDDGVTEDVLDLLAQRDEAGELQLVRNALRGRASGLNLALRATASELVVLIDADRRAPGPGWLDQPVSALLEIQFVPEPALLVLLAPALAALLRRNCKRM